MNKFILKLLYAAIAAFILCTVFTVPYELAFAGVIAAGVLLHYMGKATGELVLFDTLSPDLIKELAELRAKLKSEADASAKTEIERQIKEMELKNKDFISKADVTVMLDEKDKANQKALDTMSAELKLFKEQGFASNNKAVKNISEAVEKALQGKSSHWTERGKELVFTERPETVLETLKNVQENGFTGYKHIMSIKANTDPITISGSYSGGIIGLTDFDTSYNRVPQYKPFMRQIVNVRRTSKTYIGWAEQTGIEGDAGMVAEGAEKPQNTFKTVERNERLKKVAKWSETSKENLDDLVWMGDEIRSEIINAIARKLDDQLVNGDGTGENIKGVKYYAPEFSIAGTPLVNTVVNANNYDVLRTAAAQVRVNSKDTFSPNYFLIHPYAAAAMDMAKSAEGIYVIPPFTTVDGRRIAGMLGVESSRLDVDEFIVGDFTRYSLAIREDINISVGYIDRQFVENLVTILGEMRALGYVKANDVTAFVQGDFSFATGQLDPDAVSA